VSKRLIALIFGALAVGLIAGCGSSGSDNGGGAEISTNSLTKAEFIKQADAICLKRGKQLFGELIALNNENKGVTDSEAGKVLDEFAKTTVVPGFQSEADEIAALGAPEGEVDDVEAMLSDFEEGIKEVDDHASKIGNHDAPATKEANKLAEEFGLKVCFTRAGT